MTTSTHHRKADLTNLKSPKNFDSSKLNHFGSKKNLKSTPRVSISIPKTLSQAVSPTKGESTILKTIAGQGPGKSRQTMGLSKRNAEEDGPLATSGTNKDYSSVVPKTHRTGFTFQNS